MDSMIGKWNDWYSGIRSPQAYGSDETYIMGAYFLNGLDVEDWGCGKGYFSTVHTGGYVGVDGTETPFSDIVVDLRYHTSRTEGLFMRHVIEHNLEWELVLANAIKSFTRKMALVLFTPMSEKTKQIAWNAGVEVPDMSFSHEDIMKMVPDSVNAEWIDLQTTTQYGVERFYGFTR